MGPLKSSCSVALIHPDSGIEEISEGISTDLSLASSFEDDFCLLLLKIE